MRKLVLLVLVVVFSGWSSGANATPVITNGLVAAFEFSGDASDSSGNAHHGTEFGGITSSNYVSGVAGQALQLDGQGEYIATDTLTDTWNQWTISFFAKPDSLPPVSQGYAAIVERERLGNYHEVTVALHYSGKFWVEQDSASSPYNESIGNVLLNQWQHVAVTYNGTAQAIYLDGDLDSVYAQSNAYVDVSEPLLIGRHPNPNDPAFFSGELDELYIYNRALSASEVSTLANIPEPSTALLLGIGMMGLGMRRRRR